jgi:hypothetical protein
VSRQCPHKDLFVKMKYVEKSFALRLHRRDGTSKLLLGVTGSPPKIGALVQIRVARDEVVTAKLMHHPHGQEPAEAMEEVQQVRLPHVRRLGF